MFLGHSLSVIRIDYYIKHMRDIDILDLLEHFYIEITTIHMLYLFVSCKGNNYITLIDMLLKKLLCNKILINIELYKSLMSNILFVLMTKSNNNLYHVPKTWHLNVIVETFLLCDKTLNIISKLFMTWKTSITRGHKGLVIVPTVN